MPRSALARTSAAQGDCKGSAYTLLPEPQGTKRCQGMGAGASLQEDVPTGWHALAAMAEAADKPDLVAKIVRENQIDAATALKLDDDDLRELVDRKLDFKKLQGARDELRERLVLSLIHI